jgi:hypothetical protein
MLICAHTASVLLLHMQAVLKSELPVCDQYVHILYLHYARTACVYVHLKLVSCSHARLQYTLYMYTV